MAGTKWYKVLHSCNQSKWTFTIANQRWSDYKMSDYLSITDMAGNSVEQVLQMVIPKAIARLQLHGKVSEFGIKIIPEVDPIIKKRIIPAKKY